jgi:stearoyl-CoA desaturase (delta-9 desaturase)
MSADHALPTPRRVPFYRVVPFTLLHAACLVALYTGVSAQDLALFVALYVMRMFFITAGYHRYFAHRTFKTSRAFQLVLAFGAQTSGQQGALWWADHHRQHHRHSDRPGDAHSAKLDGFLWSHMGWFFSDAWQDTDYDNVKDLARYPELVWLDRLNQLPLVLLGVATYAAFGLSGLVVGFVWSTVATLHATYLVNSLAHMYGSRRYETTDDSRNNPLIALVTMGEGWHNNHHHYPASANQGFFWWELDPTYWILRALALMGVVWDVRTPPPHVLADRPHPRAEATQLRAECDRLLDTLAAAPDPRAQTLRASLTQGVADLDALAGSLSAAAFADRWRALVVPAREEARVLTNRR